MHYTPPDEADVVIFRDRTHGIVADGADYSTTLSRLAINAGFDLNPVTGPHRVPDEVFPRQAVHRVTALARTLHEAGYTVRVDSSIPDAAAALSAPDLAPIAETLTDVATAVEVTVRPDEVRELLDDLAGDDGPLIPTMDVLGRITDRCAGYHPAPHYRAAEDLHEAVRHLEAALASVRVASRRLPDPQALTRRTAQAAAPTMPTHRSTAVPAR
ncbi:hypothetical protein GCM10023205_04300 [Yinghuangia aomiensis]|uniref:Uncharacterized protein n=1 Tax=Yinghuangia aomiensis TaxID=676205 RepID=A0ABP9GLL6_9ACTN